VIDGWDKMMNGDCNKKNKEYQGRIIHHAERKRKKAAHMHPGLKKNI